MPGAPALASRRRRRLKPTTPPEPHRHAASRDPRRSAARASPALAPRTLGASVRCPRRERRTHRLQRPRRRALLRRRRHPIRRLPPRRGPPRSPSPGYTTASMTFSALAPRRKPTATRTSPRSTSSNSPLRITSPTATQHRLSASSRKPVGVERSSRVGGWGRAEEPLRQSVAFPRPPALRSPAVATRSSAPSIAATPRPSRPLLSLQTRGPLLSLAGPAILPGSAAIATSHSLSHPPKEQPTERPTPMPTPHRRRYRCVDPEAHTASRLPSPRTLPERGSDPS